MCKWIYTISTIILQQHLQQSRLIQNDSLISLERSVQWQGISQAAPRCLMKGGKAISKNQNVNQSEKCTEGHFSACWAGLWISTDAVTHEKKVIEPLNWVLCLLCSEDRVIEHYTQIKGLTRGQAIVQWVWHLLICEDDIFTFFPFSFCWEVAMQAAVIIACQLYHLYLSDSFFIELYVKTWSFRFHRLPVKVVCPRSDISNIKEIIWTLLYRKTLLHTLLAIN